MAITNESWIGVLCLEVIEADQLLSMDIGGASDPFCVISFGPQTFRTQVTHNTLAPKWNQECRLPIHQHSKTWTLNLAVWDWDRIGANDLIGRADVDAPGTNLIDGATHDMWLDLMTEKQKPAGRIHVRFQFKDRHVLEKTFWLEMAKFFDADGNGNIGRAELSAMLQVMDAEVDEAQVDEMFARADTDGSGEISTDELMKCMAGVPGPLFAFFTTCPVCSAEFHKPCDAEVISHLGMCFEAKDGAGKFVMGGFLSEEYASKKAGKSWFARLGTKQTDDICSNPEQVQVMDRQTGTVTEEFIPPTIRMALRTLYQSALGSKAANTERVRKLLRSMTRKYGEKYTDPKSVDEIPKFIQLHKLNVDEILDPLDSFKNFNEFFYRKLKPSARPISGLQDAAMVVSPADCRSVVFPTIELATNIWVKGQRFSVASLIGDDALAQRFEGGALGVFRLAPQDYHRIHMPVDGTIGASRPLGAEYYTVNPMAVRAEDFDVYTENKRLVTIIESPTHGTVLYIAVGATMVGSIQVSVKQGDQVRKGDEFGYFAFGGSTVLLLFEPGKIRWDDDLLANSRKPLETLVVMGTQVGRLPA